VLFADTFNNFFHPESARSAVNVLESAGFKVVVPERRLCCGRPLYDYGMLDLARSFLTRLVAGLRSYARDGVAIVCIEPSCLAVFRDELPNMLPHDEDAKRLSKLAMSLSEFLEERVESWDVPRLERRAIVHGHCHQKAVVGMDAEQKVYDRLGLRFELLDSGCCGMAGSFGFERDHYDVSVAIGEHKLLPAVRAASDEALVIADGFSCRTQIEQLTGRAAMHTAQVIEMAIGGGTNG
jgi:Fe-S oxidoreductase